MEQEPKSYESSAGVVYAIAGVVQIVIGAYAADNRIEDEMFGYVGVVLLATGSYALVAGAVARGVQLARK